MKTHTTNCKNTFIAIADDCPIDFGEVPPVKGDKKSAANIQYDMISKHPYEFTSDDVLFGVYAEKNDLHEDELKSARAAFFSKGQPCMRASALTKRYGWGVHSNEEGKIALVGSETPEYRRLKNDTTLDVVKAMKSAR